MSRIYLTPFFIVGALSACGPGTPAPDHAPADEAPSSAPPASSATTAPVEEPVPPIAILPSGGIVAGACEPAKPWRPQPLASPVAPEAVYMDVWLRHPGDAPASEAAKNAFKTAELGIRRCLANVLQTNPEARGLGGGSFRVKKDGSVHDVISIAPPFEAEFRGPFSQCMAKAISAAKFPRGPKELKYELEIDMGSNSTEAPEEPSGARRTVRGSMLDSTSRDSLRTALEEVGMTKLEIDTKTVPGVPLLRGRFDRRAFVILYLENKGEFGAVCASALEELRRTAAVAEGRSVFLAIRAEDPAAAEKLLGLVAPVRAP